MTSTPRPSEPGASGEVDRPWVAEQSTDPARAGAAAVRGPRRWGWFRVTLVVLAGMMALVCLGLVGLGFVLYNEETRPDRSAPDVVVDNYLRAMLVERSDTAASIYACSDKTALHEIRAMRDDMTKREGDFSISIRVSWGRLDVQDQRDRAVVTTEIRRTVVGGTESDIQTWRFDVVDEDGWRVCGAERMP